MKRILNLFVACIVFGMSGTAYARDAVNANIQELYVQPEGVVIFTTTASVGTWPGCATTQRFAVSVATAGGQAVYAGLLSALKAHTPITIHGKGVCDAWGDSESVGYLQVLS